MKDRFYVCRHCHNLVGMINNSGVPIMCCGEKMQPLVANTSEGALEKHIPVVEVKENLVTVNVGEVNHPMIEEHYIMWVYLETTSGGKRIVLAPGQEPKVVFALMDEKPLRVFAYCNLHGLWVKEL